MHSFDHPDLVHYVALQPTAGLIAGNILATACQDGLLRLFDMRRNTKGDIQPKSLYSYSNNYVRLIAHRVLISYSDAVSQTANQHCVLYTAMFSRAEPTVIAVASTTHGALIYDIRNLKRSLIFHYCFSFPYYKLAILILGHSTRFRAPMVV